MKKTLLRVALVVTTAMFLQLGFGSSYGGKEKRELRFFWPKIDWAQKTSKTYENYLGLATEENLKSYHLGLQALLPSYSPPSYEKMLCVVRSHPSFYGTLGKKEAMAKIQEGLAKFIAFKDKEDAHFYIAHKGGLRHFSIGKIFVGDAIIGKLDNGAKRMYPEFGHLLRCTQVNGLVDA